MVARCEGVGALLLLFCTKESRHASGVCRLLRNTVVDPVLALAAIGQLTEIDWEAMAYQDWFPYSNDDDKIILLPEELPLVRCSASSFEARESGRLEIRPKYREEFAHRGISMECARLVCRRYLAEYTDGKTILAPNEQDELASPASPTTNATTANAESERERQVLRYRRMKKIGRWETWSRLTRRSWPW